MSAPNMPQTGTALNISPGAAQDDRAKDMEKWLQATGFYDDDKREAVIRYCDQLAGFDTDTDKQMQVFEKLKLDHLRERKKERVQIMQLIGDQISGVTNHEKPSPADEDYDEAEATRYFVVAISPARQDCCVKETRWPIRNPVADILVDVDGPAVIFFMVPGVRQVRGYAGLDCFMPGPRWDDITTGPEPAEEVIKITWLKKLNKPCPVPTMFLGGLEGLLLADGGFEMSKRHGEGLVAMIESRD